MAVALDFNINRGPDRDVSRIIDGAAAATAGALAGVVVFVLVTSSLAIEKVVNEFFGWPSLPFPTPIAALVAGSLVGGALGLAYPGQSDVQEHAKMICMVATATVFATIFSPTDASVLDVVGKGIVLGGAWYAIERLR